MFRGTPCISGEYLGICPGGGAQHLLGPENSLKSVDFTGPEGA